MVLRFKNCPCCHASDFVEYYRNPNYHPPSSWTDFRFGGYPLIRDLFRCRQCDYKFINTLPENFQQFYQGQQIEDYLVLQKFRVQYFQAIKRRLEQRESPPLSRPAKILDLGCGNGEWLFLWREQARLFGTELCPAFFPSLQEKGIARVEGQDLGGSAFDLISLFDFLEHLPDPREEIEKLRRHLAPSGSLLIGVPDLDKFMARLLRFRYYLYSPMHFSYFGRESLSRLLRNAFPGARIRTFPSPRMKTDLKTVLKLLRVPLDLPRGLNPDLPTGYSASLLALVRL